MSQKSDAIVYVINFETISTIVNGIIHPPYLNQNLTLRGFVDDHGELLTDSPYNINIYDGPTILLDISAFFKIRIEEGAYIFVFYANSTGDLILFSANQDQPTVIGKWTYNASTQVFIFSFFKSCFSTLLGRLNVTFSVDSSNVVTSVTGVESFSVNGSPTEMEMGGVLNNTLSQISNGNIQMFCAIRDTPSGKADFIVEPN